jgi:hypothetical protein
MRTSRLFAVGALFLSFAWVLAGGCSSSGPDNAGGLSTGNTSGTGGGTQGNPTKVTPDASTIDGGTMDDLNALCGVGMGAGTCVPDDGDACSTYVPPLPGAGGAGGESGAATGGLSAGGAGAGGEETGGAGTGGAGGASGGASSGGASGDAGTTSGGAGNGGEGGNGVDKPGTLAAYSCQVARQNNQLLRQCVAAGTGKVNAPCFSAADCAPSYACVTENDAGRCLPYCCDQTSTCTSGTFCAERPLRKAESDMSNAEPPHVPVCVPADGCSLEDQFPCPSGSECRCKGDTACMVVRDDGTTTCMKPGNGQQGDPCPCAWNHVCSSVTQQCIKICRTDPTKDDCGTQKCQASSELPQNFGVCVGPLK